MFKVELIGNLGADAEVRVSEGTKFVAFRVANTEKWTDAKGQEHSQTDWFDATLSNAESRVIPFLKAGTKVFIRGNATKRVYSSKKDRCMKAGITIHVQELELCGGQSELVPRQLIVPDTGQLCDVSKHYFCNLPTTGMKKNDLRDLVDERGNWYQQNATGFVVPRPADDDSQQMETEAESKANEK